MTGIDVNTIVKKRGRKSKKEIEEAQQKSISQNNVNEENIIINIEDKNETDEQTPNLLNDIVCSDNDVEMSSPSDKPIAKKRGRKPKGGKIVQQMMPLNNVKESKPNVILHLKCSMKDIHSNNAFGNDFEGYSFSQSNNNLNFDIVKNSFHELINAPSKLHDCDVDIDTNDNDYESCYDIREIWKKLKILEHDLHTNTVTNKKSACFWDTCEFANPPAFIPKHCINDTYQVYGCFCSPECATAYLMEEHIDSSAKFERYQSLNHIYSKIYNYNKNIKPAPNPYYMLEKFCGNLNIQEYRSLLRNERLFLVVDKPLTRVMPELHEDNDDFIINNKIIPTNNIKMRKLQKKQTKSNILNERFGLIQN